MVIDNFNLVGIGVPPDKTDMPLPVYPDNVLAFPVTTKSFKKISGWNPQEIKGGGSMQQMEFSLGNPLDIR